MLQESAPVADNDGGDVRARRVRLGMTIDQLADEAGVDADTLGDYESGRRNPRDITKQKVASALERLEEETGLNAPPPEDVLSFDVQTDGGFRVVVKGPMKDADEVRRQVSELLRDMRRTD